jgi:CubicO group peptidase (beta-lactamase class C family)
MRKPILFFCISLLVTLYSSAQNAKIEKQLDELFTKHFKPAEPGCALLVTKQGQVIYNKAFGSADLELSIPLATDMVFKLASITKQFTAVAVLQLVEQGKISLQDSIQKFVPDYPFKGYTITIENLLTHTSGIKDYLQISYNNPNMERWDFTPKELIDSFKNHPLQFEPGTKFSYSNSGYYLLGYIIEKVSGKSYKKYMQENIFTPLGLTHTYVNEETTVIPKRVKGYFKEGSTYKNADYWSSSITYAAGILISNTEDLYKWFTGLLAYKILKKETLDKAFTAYKLKDGSALTYGYGWYILNQNNISSIEHSGIMNGFTSNQIYYPKQDIFIAVLFNSQSAPRDGVSRTVSEIVLGQSLQKANKVDAALLSSYVGTYSLSTDSKRTITVTKDNDRLFAKVSGQQAFELLFQTDTRFQLQNVKDATGEFVSENGRVSKIIVDQNGKFEWVRIK